MAAVGTFCTVDNVAPKWRLYVKASTMDPGKLGDCPFCQRVVLTLLKLNIPAEVVPIDLTVKSKEFLSVSPNGKVPVIVNLASNTVTEDSAIIADMLEKESIDHVSIVPTIDAPIGDKLVSSFFALYTASEGAERTAKKLAFEEEMNTLEAHLNDYSWLGGHRISRIDFNLAPKLYHATVALADRFQSAYPLNQFPNISNYMQIMKECDEWKKSTYPEELIRFNWSKKLE